MNIRSRRGAFYPLTKIIAVMVCLCMVTMDAAYAVPAVSTSLRGSEATEAIPADEIASSALRPPRSDSFSIPKELGFIDEFHGGTNGQTIIYIQDAHDSLEAQENIAKIIAYLVEHHGVKTVFEEGYEGPVPTDESFSIFQDPQAKEKVSYFLMDKLRLGGAEYAHINRTRDFDLIGVDSIKLHKENIEWYKKSAQVRELIEKDLEAIHKEIRVLANQYFPKELKAWMRLKRKLDEGKLQLPDYIKQILSLRGSAQKAEAISEFRLLRRILEPSHNDEPDIDPKAFFTEIDRFENDYVSKALGTGPHRGLSLKIYRLHKVLNLLKRLNRIEITPEEFDLVRKSLQEFDTKKIAEFLFDVTGKPVILSNLWEKQIQSAIRFYETVEARDEVLDRHLSNWTTNQPAILVFGGFHKNRIKSILHQKNYSYLIVSPKITEISQRHRDYYKTLMGIGHHSFEMPLMVAGAAKALSTLEGGGWSTVSIHKVLSRSPIDDSSDTSLFIRHLETVLARSEARSKKINPNYSIRQLEKGSNLFEWALEEVSRLIRHSMFVVADDYLVQIKDSKLPEETAWVVLDDEGYLIGVRVLTKYENSDIQQSVIAGVTALLPDDQGKGIGRRLAQQSLQYLRNIPDLRIRYYQASIEAANEASFKSFHHAVTDAGLTLSQPIIKRSGEYANALFFVDMFPGSNAVDDLLPPKIPDAKPLPINTDQAWKVVQQMSRSEARVDGPSTEQGPREPERSEARNNYDEERSVLRISVDGNQVQEILAAENPEDKAEKMLDLLESVNKLGDRIDQERRKASLVNPDTIIEVFKDSRSLFSIDLRTRELVFENVAYRLNVPHDGALTSKEFYSVALAGDGDKNGSSISDLFVSLHMPVISSEDFMIERPLAVYYDPEMSQLLMTQSERPGEAENYVKSRMVYNSTKHLWIVSTTSSQEMIRDVGELIPVFHVHIHPKGRTSPSFSDLGNAFQTDIPEVIVSTDKEGLILISRDNLPQISKNEFAASSMQWHLGFMDVTIEQFIEQHFYRRAFELPATRSEVRATPWQKNQLRFEREPQARNAWNEKLRRLDEKFNQYGTIERVEELVGDQFINIFRDSGVLSGVPEVKSDTIRHIFFAASKVKGLLKFMEELDRDNEAILGVLERMEKLGESVYLDRRTPKEWVSTLPFSPRIVSAYWDNESDLTMQDKVLVTLELLGDTPWHLHWLIDVARQSRKSRRSMLRKIQNLRKEYEKAIRWHLMHKLPRYTRALLLYHGANKEFFSGKKLDLKDPLYATFTYDHALGYVGEDFLWPGEKGAERGQIITIEVPLAAVIGFKKLEESTNEIVVREGAYPVISIKTISRSEARHRNVDGLHVVRQRVSGVRSETRSEEAPYSIRVGTNIIDVEAADKRLKRLFNQAGIVNKKLEVSVEKGRAQPTPPMAIYHTLRNLRVPQKERVTILDAGHHQGAWLLQTAHVLGHLYPDINFKLIGIEEDETLFRESKKLLETAEAASFINPGSVDLRHGDFNDKEFQVIFSDADIIYYYAHGTHDIDRLADTIANNVATGMQVIEFGMDDQLKEPLLEKRHVDIEKINFSIPIPGQSILVERPYLKIYTVGVKGVLKKDASRSEARVDGPSTEQGPREPERSEARSEKAAKLSEEKIGVIFPAPSSLDDMTHARAQALYERYQSVRKLYDDAVRYLDDREHYSLSKLLLADFSSKSRELSKVVPATVLYEIAVYRAFEEELGRPFTPRFFSGSSTGIFAAMVAAKSVTLKDMMLYLKQAIELIDQAATEVDPYALFILKGVESREIKELLKPGEVELTADTSPIKLTMVVRIPEVNKGRTPATRYSQEWKDLLEQRVGALEDNTKTVKRIYPADPGVHHSFFGGKIQDEFSNLVQSLTVLTPDVPLLNPFQPSEVITQEAGVRNVLTKSLFRTVESAGVIREMANRGVEYFVGMGPGTELEKRTRVLLPAKRTLNVNDIQTVQDISAQITRSEARVDGPSTEQGPREPERSEARGSDEEVERLVDKWISDLDTDAEKHRQDNVWSQMRVDYNIGEIRDSVREALKKIVRSVLSDVVADESISIYDVGAGHGYLPSLLGNWLKSKNYIPFDISHAFLNEMKRRGLADKTVQGSVYDLSRYVQDANFIVGMDSYDTFIELEDAVRETYEALQPGGYFVYFQTLHPDPAIFLTGSYAPQFAKNNFIYTPRGSSFFRTMDEVRTVLRPYAKAVLSNPSFMSFNPDFIEHQRLVAELRVSTTSEHFFPRLKAAVENAGFVLELAELVKDEAVVDRDNLRHRLAAGRGQFFTDDINVVDYSIDQNVRYDLQRDIPSGKMLERAEVIVVVAKKPITEKGQHAQAEKTSGRSEARGKALTLQEAYDFLTEHQNKLSILESQKDLEKVKDMAEKIENEGVERVLVAGGGSQFLPLFLALMGKEVVFVDHDVLIARGFQGVVKKLQSVLDGNLVGVRLNVQTIISEIGSLRIEEEGLTPHSFDLVTMIDLVGGIPQGHPEEWIQTATDLLRADGGLLLLDDSAYYPMLDFSKSQQLANLLKNPELLFDGAYFGGAYDLNPGNRFYRLRSEVREAAALEERMREINREDVQNLQGKYVVPVEMEVFEGLEPEQQEEFYKAIKMYSENEKVNFIFIVDVRGDRQGTPALSTVNELAQKYGNVRVQYLTSTNAGMSLLDASEIRGRKILSVLKEGLEEGVQAEKLKKELTGETELFWLKYLLDSKGAGLLLSAIKLLDSGQEDLVRFKGGFTENNIPASLRSEIQNVLMTYTAVIQSA